MKGTLGRQGILGRQTTIIFNQTLIPSSTFSTSSGGSGRGRGRGTASPPTTPFLVQTPGKPIDEDPKAKPNGSSQTASGLGHGRGKIPISPNPIIPSFSSWMPGNIPSVGRGRTNGEVPKVPNLPNQDPQSQSGVVKKPIFFKKDDGLEQTQKPHLDGFVVEDIIPAQTQKPHLGGFVAVEKKPHSGGFVEEEKGFQATIMPGLPGAGRGKPGKFAEKERPSEENRHIKPLPDVKRGEVTRRRSEDGSRMSNEEARKKAMGILARGGDGGMARGGRGAMEDGGRGRGFRGGRAFRGGGRGTNRSEGRSRRPSKFDDDENEEIGSDIYLGDDADGEKLAKRLGPDMMNKLTEAFEEMSDRILPSPMQDEYVDAMHTNYMIECEPEYLMGDFDRNPDIDDTPAMSLRDWLEKQKPFLMAYEGIKSQEEWDQIIEELLRERLPLLKEIVDYYSGPDRVTAKQQQHELERVASTFPDSAPSSLKHFTDRAVLSLQSNPGWGWDKKCQFMDKLVWEAQQPTEFYTKNLHLADPK